MVDCLLPVALTQSYPLIQHIFVAWMFTWSWEHKEHIILQGIYINLWRTGKLWCVGWWPVPRNTVSLKHSHLCVFYVHSSECSLRLPLHYSSRAENLQQTPYDPQRKIFIIRLFRKLFANPWTSGLFAIFKKWHSYGCK